MDLTDQQVDKLIHFAGHGDLLNSRILFFGNEEGLNGNNLEDEINLRVKYCSDKNTPGIPDNKDICYLVDWEIQDKALNSPMLQFQSRLLLFLNDPNGHWFATKEKNPAAFNQIKEYQRTELYREGRNRKFQTGLIDLRPLPRFTERTWPFDNLCRRKYLAAFHFKKLRKPVKKYIDLRDQRVNVLKNCIDHCRNAEMIIGIGEKKTKRRFFESIYNLEFKQIINEKFLFAEGDINNRRVIIILSDFFDYRILGLEKLEMLAKRVNEIFIK